MMTATIKSLHGVEWYARGRKAVLDRLDRTWAAGLAQVVGLPPDHALSVADLTWELQVRPPHLLATQRALTQYLRTASSAPRPLPDHHLAVSAIGVDPQGVVPDPKREERLHRQYKSHWREWVERLDAFRRIATALLGAGGVALLRTSNHRPANVSRGADFEIKRRRFRAVSRKQRPAVTGLNGREFSIFAGVFFDLSSAKTQSMILCVFALLK